MVVSGTMTAAKQPCDRVWETLRSCQGGKVVLSQSDRQALLAYHAETSRWWTLLRKRETQVQYFRCLAAHTRPANDREFEAFGERFGPRAGAPYDQVQAQMFHMAQGANLCRMLLAECRELSRTAQATLTLPPPQQTHEGRSSRALPPDTMTREGLTTPAAYEEGHHQWKTKLQQELQETRCTLGGMRDALKKLISEAARRAEEAERQRRATEELRDGRERMTEQLCEARAELAVARRAAARAESAEFVESALASRALLLRPPISASPGDLMLSIVDRALALQDELERQTTECVEREERAVRLEAQLSAAIAMTTEAAVSIASETASGTRGAALTVAPTRASSELQATATSAKRRGAVSGNTEKEMLTFIAKKVQYEWMQIFGDLMSDAGVDLTEVTRFKAEIMYGFSDYKAGQAYAALKRWKRSMGMKVSFEKLKDVLLRNHRKDLADYINRKMG